MAIIAIADVTVLNFLRFNNVITHPPECKSKKDYVETVDCDSDSRCAVGSEQLGRKWNERDKTKEEGVDIGKMYIDILRKDGSEVMVSAPVGEKESEREKVREE